MSSECMFLMCEICINLWTLNETTPGFYSILFSCIQKKPSKLKSLMCSFSLLFLLPNKDQVIQGKSISELLLRNYHTLPGRSISVIVQIMRSDTRKAITSYVPQCDNAANLFSFFTYCYLSTVSFVHTFLFHL